MMIKLQSQITHKVFSIITSPNHNNSHTQHAEQIYPKGNDFFVILYTISSCNSYMYVFVPFKMTIMIMIIYLFYFRYSRRSAQNIIDV